MNEVLGYQRGLVVSLHEGANSSAAAPLAPISKFLM